MNYLCSPVPTSRPSSGGGPTAPFRLNTSVLTHARQLELPKPSISSPDGIRLVVHVACFTSQSRLRRFATSYRHRWPSSDRECLGLGGPEGAARPNGLHRHRL